MNVKKEIIIEGDTYKLMRIGIPANPATDVRFESSWYTIDPRKQVKEEDLE